MHCQHSSHFFYIHRTISQHKQNEFTQETKLITGKLIELNPDFYTLWNFRRNIVNHFRAEITQTEKNDTKSSSDVINGNDEDSSETNNIDSNDDAKSDSCSRKYNDKNDKDENDNNDTDTDKPLAAEQENKQRDSLTVLFAGELRLTEAALRKNPKSYYAWHHRKWVVDQGYNSIDDELLLCDKMLSLDSRNCKCIDVE